MSESKTKKPKNPNERKFAPKAGPNSLGFKGKKRASNRTNNPTLLDDLKNDGIAKRDDRRAALEADRAAKAFKARVLQAQTATESAAVTTLPEGSIARKVALAIIEEFPAAEPREEGVVTVSRTSVAIELMHDKLDANDALFNKEIATGIRQARTALKGAFIRLSRT